MAVALSNQVELVAVDAFGDRFLKGAQGAIFRLDTSIGRLDRLCDSLEQFKESVGDPEQRKQWFVEDVALSLAEQGLVPTKGECLGYKTPIIFKESSGDATNVYLAELCEYVSFLGTLHKQMKDVPDGGKVRLTIGEE